MNRRTLGSTALIALVVSTSLPSYAQVQIRPTVPRPDGQPINPAHERAKTEAEQAHSQGQFDKAIELTTGVIRQNSRDHVAYYLRASARVELGIARGDTEPVREGISDARQSIALTSSRDPNYYLPYLYGMTNLAAMENRKAHAETSVKVADDVIARATLKPDQRANLLYQRAMARMYLQEYDAAAKDYAQAIQLVPSHLGAHVGLCDAYASAGKIDQATASFGKAIEQFPKNPLVYNQRGSFYQQQGKGREAVADFTKAVEIAPDYHWAFTNRGYAHMDLGDYSAAENDFTQSLTVNPSQPMALSLRGTARLLQGKLAEAVQDYQQVVAMDPQNPVAHSDLGFAHFFDGDYSNALKAFDQAVKLDENARYVNPWRAMALVRLNKTDEAKQKFQQVLSKSADQRDWIEGLVAYALEESTDDELLSLISKDDESIRNAQTCEAHFFIGRRQDQLGEAEKAAEHYQKALETKQKQLSAYRGAKSALEKLAAKPDSTTKVSDAQNKK